MKRDTETSFLIYIGPAIVVTLSVLALIILLIKPPQISKELLESVDFRESLTERVKRLTGLELVYSSLEATADLRFTLTNVELSRLSGQRVLHSCRTALVSGQFTNEGQLFSLSSLNLGKLSCQATVDASFRPIALFEQASPALSDFDLLFGLSVADARIAALDLNITRVRDDGTVLDELRLAEASATLGFDATIAHQTAHVTLEGESSGLLFERKDSQVQTMARLKGVFDANYDSSSGIKGSLLATVVDQNFVPTYVSGQFPATVAFAFEGRGRLPSVIQVTDFEAGVAGVAQFRSQGSRFYLSQDGKALHFEVEGLEGQTQSGVAKLLALNTEMSSVRLAQVKNGTLSGWLRFNGIVPTADATLAVETLTIQPLANAPFTVSGVKLHGQLHSQARDRNKLLVTLSGSGQKATYPATAYESHDLKLSARATVSGDSRVDLETLAFYSKGHATTLQANGWVEWVDGLPQKFNLKGLATQELRVSLFDTYGVDATAEIPFAVLTRENGSVQADLGVRAVVPSIEHENFVATNINFYAPVSVTLKSGLPNDLLFTSSYDQTLDDVTQSIAQWRTRFSGSIGHISVIQDPANPSNTIEIDNTSFEGHFSQSGWLISDIMTNGHLSISSYTAPSLDGSERQTFNHPTTLTWTFSPLNASTPGLRLRARVQNTKTDQAFKATALVSPENHRALVVKYQTRSDVFEHLASTLGMDSHLSFTGLDVTGELKFADFFAPRSFGNWNVLLVNLPYSGRVSGHATAKAEEVQIERIAKTDLVQLKAPRLTLRHSGTSEKQSFSVTTSADELTLKTVNGQHFAAERTVARLDGSLDLPFPSRAARFKGDLVSGHIYSAGDNSLDIPDADVAFEGALIDGTSLEFSRITGLLGGFKVAEAKGKIASLHPIDGVSIEGEVRPHLPAIPIQRLSRNLAPTAKAHIPFQIVSGQQGELVATGKLSVQDLSFQTSRQIVRNVTIDVPFALLLTVAPDNSLVLELDPALYRERGLVGKGVVTAQASPLPQFLGDQLNSVPEGHGTMIPLDLANRPIRLDAHLTGNKILFRSPAKEPALILGEGRTQTSHDQVQVIFDERGMVLEVDGKEYLVASRVMEATY